MSNKLTQKSGKNPNFQQMILTALFSAIIIIMTVVPYTGYISYGGVIEITTLHVVVIIGACFLDVKWSAVLGGVWGITCMLRAFTNPLFMPFINPVVSVLPRICVGIVTALLMAGFCKTRLPRVLSISFSAILGSLTNTVLVLTAYYYFAGLIPDYKAIYDLFKGILLTLIGVNGLIELALAIFAVPIVVTALRRPVGQLYLTGIKRV